MKKKELQGMPIIVEITQGVDVMAKLVMSPAADGALLVAIDTHYAATTEGLFCVLASLPYFLLNHMPVLPDNLKDFERDCERLFEKSQVEAKLLADWYLELDTDEGDEDGASPDW